MDELFLRPPRNNRDVALLLGAARIAHQSLLPAPLNHSLYAPVRAMQKHYRLGRCE